LALYGEMIERSFLLGMEYMAGAPGTEDHIFQIDDCQVQVLIRDDQSNPETTATIARELIDVEKIDILVGTVSSGATATLQGIALENDKILIVAPAAANEITGANFNDHTFRVSRTNYHDAVNQCEFMVTQYKKFVQIAPTMPLAGAAPRPSATPAPSSAVSSSPTTSWRRLTRRLHPLHGADPQLGRRRLDRHLGRSRVHLHDAGRQDLGVMDKMAMAPPSSTTR